MPFPSQGRPLVSDSGDSPVQVSQRHGYTLGPTYTTGSSSTRRNINPRPFVAPAPVPRGTTTHKSPDHPENGGDDYELWQGEADGDGDIKEEYDAGPSGTYELSEDGFEEVEPIAIPRARSFDYGLPAEPPSEAGPSNWESKAALQTALAKLEGEIQSVVEQIEPLQKLHSTLLNERRDLMAQISSLSSVLTRGDLRDKFTSNGKLPEDGQSSVTDYQNDEFEWSGQLKKTMKKVWGIDSFRLCQAGVVNANMDSRDIVCVMPTGGGKSLTYQLPALLAPGTTIVISPLISLITDQVLHLREVGVETVMLTGATSKADQSKAYDRMVRGAGPGGKDIKLCYVTPEKIAKSKTFVATLEKLNASGRLARIVIDEAHCCSQLGHDFRPDYKKLSVLKTLFPRVPILAVTATLSTKTMPDLLKILRLPPICDGHAAKAKGTVFFSAPLYRPNLHYKVMLKHSNAKTVIDHMGQWIQDHHAGESGIIYCLSKKDAETVADSLRDWSRGTIKTATYHAAVDDFAKERVHIDWRQGKVNVICATIAFGLGIDKGDVRFVIHHSMSKSLESFYQESGRAGRDGKDSDCLLLYRGMDATRLASLTYGDVDGSSKLREMLKFAQDLVTCRKVAFANYFSASSHLSVNAWDHADSLSQDTPGVVSVCRHCDNCVRDPATIVTKDVTLEAWKVLKVIKAVEQAGGKATLSALADLVRGLGGGSFTLASSGKKAPKDPEKMTLDVNEIAEGKVILSGSDTEVLLISMILKGYLEESYHATAYSVNVYMISGPNAVRLARLSPAQIENGHATTPILCTFPINIKLAKAAKPKAASKGKKRGQASEEEGATTGKKRKVSAAQGTKAAHRVANGEESEDFDEAIRDVYTDEDEADELPTVKSGIRNARAASSRKAETVYLFSESE